MSKITKNINNFANNKNVRNFASKLCTPAALLPVILLETTVMTGRTYQAKKRGGDIEARERLTEESISAVIWLWGIKTVNKAFDFLIDKVGKVKEKTGVKDFSFDTGNDHIRKPFEHVTENLNKTQKNSIAALKFSKIVASAAISVGFMGFVLPKINQKITKNMLDKKEQQTGEHLQPIKIEHRQQRKTEINEFLTMSRGSAGDPQRLSNNPPKVMETNEFLTMSRGSAGDPTKSSSNPPKIMETNEFLTMSRGSAGDPKFQGGTFFEIAAHQLENNNITQLLTIDAGLFTGRAVNARNEYEQREILFRDITSSFFYVAATPLIYKGLCALDSLKGKNTELSPDRAHDLHEKIMSIFPQGQKEISASDFEKKVFGTRQVNDAVFTKAGKIFDKDVVSIEKMHKFIEENVLDAETASILKTKSSKLSQLQPGNILTKSQLTNLFNNGLLNEPEFINKLINESTDKKAMNPVKFIPQKKVDEKRNFINDYAQSILDKAKKENLDKISEDFLNKMKARNLVTKLGYWGVGMAISGYFLSTAIPKIQYWMTQRTTGHNDFPGIQQYEKDKKLKKH